MFTGLPSLPKLRVASIAAMALVFACLHPTPAMAQRYLTEIVVSTTNPSGAPVITPELKFGSALNAYLLVDGVELRRLMDWYANGSGAAPTIAGVLSTNQASLNSPEAKALSRRGNQIMVIAVSASSLSAAGIGPQNLVSPRKATLVGIVSPRDPASRVGKGQLRF